MNSIYVIVSGHSSDNSIVGYCDDEKEAAKICDRNNSLDGNMPFWEKWHYWKASKMKVSENFRGEW